jgi:hypothetical protein
MAYKRMIGGGGAPSRFVIRELEDQHLTQIATSVKYQFIVLASCVPLRAAQSTAVANITRPSEAAQHTMRTCGNMDWCGQRRGKRCSWDFVAAVMKLCVKRARRLHARAVHPSGRWTRPANGRQLR